MKSSIDQLLLFHTDFNSLFMLINASPPLPDADQLHVTYVL